jgi:hypothetical protein
LCLCLCLCREIVRRKNRHLFFLDRSRVRVRGSGGSPYTVLHQSVQHRVLQRHWHADVLFRVGLSELCRYHRVIATIVSGLRQECAMIVSRAPLNVSGSGRYQDFSFAISNGFHDNGSRLLARWIPVAPSLSRWCLAVARQEGASSVAYFKIASGLCLGSVA